MMTQLQRVWRRNRREWLTFLAFVAPNASLFVLFTYWPIVYSLWLSFTDWDLLRSSHTVIGPANYVELMRDPRFWRVLLNTVVYGVSVVTIAQVLAFALALLLNAPVPFKGLFRTLAFLPHVTTTAAAALVWVLLLHPQFGPLNVAYRLVGVSGPNFLETASLALVALIVVGVWKETAFSSIFYLAGLQNLPADCYEAASIEGAGPLQRLRHLTFPLMGPVAFFLIVSGLIAATKTFDTVAIMTEGGPVYPSSSMYVYHLYTLAFREFRAGYASAFAMLFFAITIAAILVQFRYIARRIHYGE